MVDDISTQLRKGVVEYCVLGLLEQEPMYGWQLSQALIEHGLIASIGTLYPLLARLRDRDLIIAFEQQASGTDGAPPSSGPTRKYYRLTDLGVLQLAKFREQWRPFIHTVNTFVEKEA